MNTHKKRAKGSWRQGKGYKGDSEERMYAKKEIEEELKASEDNYLTRHKGKRKKNLKARLEYRISWYKQIIEKYQMDSLNSSNSHYFRSGLREAEKEYQELLDKEKK
jgi:hypothetical protein